MRPFSHGLHNKGHSGSDRPGLTGVNLPPAPGIVAIVALTLALLSNCTLLVPGETEPPASPVPHRDRPQLCGALPESDRLAASGIEGHVASVTRLGPGDYFGNTPAQATIAIVGHNDNAVVELATDPDGYFCVLLSPGTYTLRPEPYPVLAFVQDQTVTVHPGQITAVEIVYEIPLT